MYYDEYDWREYRGDVVWVGGFVFKSGKITIKPQRYGEDPFIYGTIEMESPFCLNCMEARKKRVFEGEFLPHIEGERGIILVKNRLLGGGINYEVIHINDRFAKSDWFEWIRDNEEFYYITNRKARYLVSDEELKELWWKEVKDGVLKALGIEHNTKKYKGEIVWSWGDAVMEQGNYEKREFKGDRLSLILDTPKGKHIFGMATLYKDDKEVVSAMGELFWYVERGKGMVVVADREHPEKLTLNEEDLKAVIFINMEVEEEWEIPKMEGGAIIYGGVG